MTALTSRTRFFSSLVAALLTTLAVTAIGAADVTAAEPSTETSVSQRSLGVTAVSAQGRARAKPRCGRGRRLVFKRGRWTCRTRNRRRTPVSPPAPAPSPAPAPAPAASPYRVGQSCAPRDEATYNAWGLTCAWTYTHYIYDPNFGSIPVPVYTLLSL